VGDTVFAIGSPHRLGWTHTQGVVSQLRLQPTDGPAVHVIQTQTALNPGNSGGGLFDQQGRLVGINTWTNDKRVSEGLGFAISLETLLELHPPGLAAPAVEER
jgi:serine protease Do